MKKIKIPKGTITIQLDKDLMDALTRTSLELSLKHEKRITRTKLIEKALLAYGIKPRTSK